MVKKFRYTKFHRDVRLLFNRLIGLIGPIDWTSQQAFTCLKLTIETLEQGVKYVQS